MVNRFTRFWLEKPARKAWFFAIAMAIATIARGAESRPNIVLILADDLGWGDLAAQGKTGPLLPRIERLAADGVRMSAFYAPCPYCAPSRASLLTGRYPLRCGLNNNPFPPDDPIVKNGDKLGLPPSEITLGESLAAAGYRVACFGKWHLGHQPPFRPSRQGFDRFFGILYANDMRPLELFEGETRVEYPVVQTTLTRRITEHARAFIRERGAEPFFLYLPEIAVHKPLAPGEQFYESTGKGLYADALAELDWSVGQVLDELAEQGLEKNTLVIFTNDNGPWYGGSTGGLRGMKGQNWEGGIRVPLIARWPGKIPPGTTSDELGQLTDLFTTIHAAAEVDLPADRVIDGLDLLPAWTGQGAPPRWFVCTWRQESLCTIRQGAWKLHLAPPEGKGFRLFGPQDKWVDPRRPDGVRILAPFEQPPATEHPGVTTGDPVDGMALFDLAGDPAEQKNVAAAHADVVARLRSEAERVMAGLGKPLDPPAKPKAPSKTAD